MTEPEHAKLDTRRRRLLYRSNYRGTKESDILVGGFVSARIATLTDSDLDELEKIIELPDVLLAEWLSGRKPIPPEADNAMLRRMKAAAGA